MRPPQKLIWSSPHSFICCFCPWRNPSPTDPNKSSDSMPQAIPNIVSTLRSLWDHRSLNVCVRLSRICEWIRKRSSRQDYFVACLQPGKQLRLGSVGDAELHGDLTFAIFGLGVGDLNGSSAVLSVLHGGLRDQQDAFLLFVDDLGVGAHVGLELAAGIGDRDAHLEG